ncbi:MAG: ATP-binding protein [Bacteroidota bacterium]
MISRILENKITQDLFKGKAIILYGPRQSGKTTLIDKIAKDSGLQYLVKNGDEPDTRDLFENITSTRLKSVIGQNKLLIIDEAQRIANIGLTIKLVTDNLKDVQVIATGSSAFELAESIREPLTGRKFEHFLFPVSYEEMSAHIGQSEERRLLEHRLIFGYYPDILNHPGEERRLLNLLSDSYLYKDLFAYERIKKPSLLQKLLKAIALQLGNEVSYNELSRLIGADKETVERYIDLLEKAFVVFTLPSFSRNLRTELRKSRKIYFFDNGIRNAILSNFTTLNLRTDKGALWENFLVSERRKVVNYHDLYFNSYFWRTKNQQEIDYIEERDGVLTGYEFKWNQDNRVKAPITFSKAYPGSGFNLITPATFELFVGTDEGK